MRERTIPQSLRDSSLYTREPEMQRGYYYIKKLVYTREPEMQRGYYYIKKLVYTREPEIRRDYFI